MILYALFFLLLTESLFRFGGTDGKVILSLMNIVLIIIPLVSIVFGTMYLYHSREFIELLLSQPIERHKIFWGIYAGLAIPLSAGFALGVGIPSLIYGVHSGNDAGSMGALLLSGIFLTFIFVALSFSIAIRYEDRLKGLGLSIVLWFFFAIMFDGIVLLLIYTFGDYPLETAIIGISMLNPIDIARTILLLQFDISALMGYTGAVFHKFFSGWHGMLISASALTLWVVLPLLSGVRVFNRKDF
jgi:Cu-processing system permease protein